MVTADSNPSTTGNRGWFKTTQWTLVLAAGQTHSDAADAALAHLCQIYWYPLYLFVRRQGVSPEQAQDLVQGFFERLLEKKYLAGADPQKGRFRSFLLVTLKRYLANEWDRANTQKRGGGRVFLAWDERETEERYLAEPSEGLTPEKAFDRLWAITLLEEVLERLKTESYAAGRAKLYEALEPLLTGEDTTVSYAEIAKPLGMSEGAARTAAHRLRQRYRELLRVEIANTVDSPEAIEEEMRELFAAVS